MKSTSAVYVLTHQLCKAELRQIGSALCAFWVTVHKLFGREHTSGSKLRYIKSICKADEVTAAEEE